MQHGGLSFGIKLENNDVNIQTAGRHLRLKLHFFFKIKTQFTKLPHIAGRSIRYRCFCHYFQLHKSNLDVIFQYFYKSVARTLKSYAHQRETT